MPAPESRSVRSRRRLTLGLKLILGIVFVLVAAVGAGTFYGNQVVSRVAQSAVNERRADGQAAIERLAQLTLRSLTLSAAAPLAESNFSYLQELVTAARREDP